MSENAPVGLGAILQASRRSDPADVPALAVAAAEGFGGTDVVVYLVDFGQQVLEPLPDNSSHEELSDSEPVATSVAGRSFVQRQTMTAERPDGTRVWVPVVEGTEVTGVLAITVPEADLQTIGACEDLGLLVGYLIAVQARVTDVYNLHRRRKAMNLAASMQWDLLPPLAIQSRRVARGRPVGAGVRSGRRLLRLRPQWSAFRVGHHGCDGSRGALGGDGCARRRLLPP